MTHLEAPHKIAIVGGGLSGALVAIHLLRQAQHPLIITLIEKEGFPGRGLAYGTTVEQHLLNVPAGSVSALADNPSHFLDWARLCLKSGLPPDESSFLPRNLYGEYIQYALKEAMSSAHPSVRMDHIQGEVVGLCVEKDRVMVQIRNREDLAAHQAVLAWGNFPPSDPSVENPVFYKSTRYVHNVWRQDALENIGPEDDVLLIGSGLTMVDVAVALHARNHRGHIHVLSRHGLLPITHGRGAEYPSFLAGKSFHTISALFGKVRQEIRFAREKGRDWRPVIDAMRPELQRLWGPLPPSEKQRFLRHLRTYWDIHRHRIAPQIGTTLEQMRRSGRFHLQAAHIYGYREVSDGVDVIMRKRFVQDQEILHVHHVLNCTMPECDYRKIDHSLMQQMMRDGLIRSDLLALGIDTTPDGALINSRGESSSLLFTLGPPRKGTLWETTAIPEIREQASKLATLLCQLRLSAQMRTPVENHTNFSMSR